MKPPYRYVMMWITFVFTVIGVVAYFNDDVDNPHPVFWASWSIFWLLAMIGVWVYINWEYRKNNPK